MRWNVTRSSPASRDLLTPVLTRVSLAVMLLLPLVAMYQAAAQETLTNADIVRMVQAHLGADVIVGQIRNNPGKYSLTTNSLIRLKQSGVPDNVITAMQAKTGGSPENESSRTVRGSESAELPAKRSEASSYGTSERWQIRQTKDPMTDQVSAQAFTTVRGNPRGEFGVEAFCEDDSQLDFYIYSQTRGLSLKRSAMPQTITTSDRFGGGQEGSISTPQECVVAQIRVGSGPVQSKASVLCDQEYATLVFDGDLSHAARQQGQMMKKGMSAVTTKENEATMNSFINGFTELQAAIAQGGSAFSGAIGIAQMSDVLKAESMRIQLPFTNGESSTIELHPQDSTFQTYTSRCAAPQSPAPRTASVDSSPGSLAGNRSTLPYGDIHQAVPHAVDGFVFGSAATRAARIYRGNVEGFASALPDFVNRAAAGSGLPAQRYDKEIPYIINAARTCARITPQLAAGMQFYGVENPAKLGEPYKVCSLQFQNVSDAVRSYNHAQERGLVMAVRPTGTWRAGRGFTLSLYFTGLRSDTGTSMQALFDEYGVVSATITASP